MKKKFNKKLLLKEINKNIYSKEYSIDELIELGKKYNKMEIAPPLYNHDISKLKKTQEN